MANPVAQSATVLMVLGVLFGVRNEDQGAPKMVQEAESYAVYASLLPTEWPARVARAKSLVFQKETTIHPGCVPSGDGLETGWRQVLDDFRAANAGAPVILEGYELGVPYVAVSSTEIRAILLEAPDDGMFGWRAFYRRYPDSGGFLQVSAVGFDDSKSRALVYMGHSCGGLCGGGMYHFLAKMASAWRELKLPGVTLCAWAS